MASSGSRPERTRSLPNRYLDMRHVDFVPQATLDFLRGRRLEEHRERFLEVGPRLGDGISLTDDIHFGAQGNVAVVFTPDDRG